MIIKRQNMSENNWNHFKIVPQGHNNCQLSIVNCQFGEAAKFQFAVPLRKTDARRIWPGVLLSDKNIPIPLDKGPFLWYTVFIMGESRFLYAKGYLSN